MSHTTNTLPPLPEPDDDIGVFIAGRAVSIDVFRPSTVRDAQQAAYDAGYRAALAQAQPDGMDAAIAAGDGTLHGAIDYWQARAERAEQRVPQGWLSTGDRLPEDGQRVVALIWPYDDRSKEQISVDAIFQHGAFLQLDTGDDLWHPSHWCLLPAAPKAEEAP